MSKHTECLPVGPFRAWLAEVIDPDSRVDVQCETLGISSRTVREILAGHRPTVRLDTVDRALQGHDGLTFLWDLYPALYAFEAVPS